jgi:hypothetical protein
MENRVKFKIGEIEFESEGSADVVERERSVFLNMILPAAVDAIVRTRGSMQEAGFVDVSDRQELLPSNSTPSINNAIFNDSDLSRTSLASFIKNYGALNDQDFTLFAAYFDEKKNGALTFSSEIIKKYYEEARRPEYSNNSVLLGQLAKKGLIMDAPNAEVKNPKQYIITADGISYVESYIPKVISTEKKKMPSKAKKAPSKVKSIYSDLCADDLNLKNYPEIKAQNNFKKQMLLVMYIVSNESKGDTFSVLDLQFLMTDVLGLPATADQINGIFKKNRTWFKAEQDPNNKKSIRRKLLEGAKDFARNIIVDK